MADAAPGASSLTAPVGGTVVTERPSAGGRRPTRVMATVAVVVPAHRASEAFDRCLRSIAQLDPPPDQLVIAVDGGDEAVAARAREAGADVVVIPDQSGPAAARNRAVERARTDVVFFLDSDVEVIDPGIVGRVAATFTEHQHVAAVIGSYDDLPHERNAASLYKNLLNHHVHQHAREEGFTFWGACGAMRRDVFRAVGGFDEDYVAPSIEDIELGYRIRAAGFSVLVDKDLRIRHLKRWTPSSLLRTDVLQRALPWSALILRTRRLENDLNVGVRERLAALIAIGGIAMAFAAVRRPVLLLGLPVAFAVTTAMDREFFGLLRRRGGRRVAAWGALWHFGYHVYSALGFVAALGRQLVFGAQPANEPWPGSPRRRVRLPAYEVAAVRRELRHPDGQLLARSRRVRLGVPILLYLLAAVALAPAFSSAVHVEDLPQLRAAQLYADGDIGAAINPYWGPLFSWLLAPLLAVGVGPTTAASILQVAIGAGIVVAIRRLCLACDVRTATADGMALVFIPLVLHLTFLNGDADFLGALLLLLLASELAPSTDEGRVGRAVRAGVWGGAAFLTDPYALPVVVLATLGIRGWRRWDAHRRGGSEPWLRHLRLDAITFGMLVAVVSPWVVAVSVDRGTFTVSLPASADAVEQFVGQLDPDDPGDGLAGDPATAGDADGPVGVRQRLSDSLLPDRRDLASAASQLLPVLALGGIGAWVALRRRGRRAPTPLAAVTVLVLVYLAGFPFTSVDGRFLWFVVLALAPFVATAIDLPWLRPRLAARDPEYPLWRLGGFAVFAALLTAQLLLALPWSGESREVSVVARRIDDSPAGRLLDGARVASVDRWSASSVLCFHLGCTYVGRLDAGAAAGLEGRVDHVLDWDDEPPSPIDAELDSVSVVVAAVDGLTVREVRPR